MPYIGIEANLFLRDTFNVQSFENCFRVLLFADVTNGGKIPSSSFP